MGTKTKSKINPVIYYEKQPVVLVPLDEALENDSRFSVEQQNLSSFDVEYLAARLSLEELELLILKFMGFKSEEIVEIMGLSPFKRYYRLNRKLKKNAQILLNES